MFIVYFWFYLSPTHSFASRFMWLVIDWVALLYPQMISGTDAASL